MHQRRDARIRPSSAPVLGLPLIVVIACRNGSHGPSLVRAPNECPTGEHAPKCRCSGCADHARALAARRGPVEAAGSVRPDDVARIAGGRSPSRHARALGRTRRVRLDDRAHRRRLCGAVATPAGLDTSGDPTRVPRRHRLAARLQWRRIFRLLSLVRDAGVLARLVRDTPTARTLFGGRRGAPDYSDPPDRR